MLIRILLTIAIVCIVFSVRQKTALQASATEDDLVEMAKKMKSEPEFEKEGLEYAFKQVVIHQNIQELGLDEKVDQLIEQYAKNSTGIQKFFKNIPESEEGEQIKRWAIATLLFTQLEEKMMHDYFPEQSGSQIQEILLAYQLKQFQALNENSTASRNLIFEICRDLNVSNDLEQETKSHLMNLVISLRHDASETNQDLIRIAYDDLTARSGTTPMSEENRSRAHAVILSAAQDEEMEFQATVDAISSTNDESMRLTFIERFVLKYPDKKNILLETLRLKGL